MLQYPSKIARGKRLTETTLDEFGSGAAERDESNKKLALKGVNFDI